LYVLGVSRAILGFSRRVNRGLPGALLQNIVSNFDFLAKRAQAGKFSCPKTADFFTPLLAGYIKPEKSPRAFRGVQNK